MTCFDFSSYVRCPKGWRILRADSELWLDHIASDRVYYITSPVRGEYELFYTSVAQNDRQFVARSDSVFNMFRLCGILMPQPTQNRQLQLTIKKAYARK